MIRQSRERPLGELELLIRPLKKCRLSSNNDTDSEGAYDNDLLSSNSPNPLEQSLEALRNDMLTGHLIEQYEVNDLYRKGNSSNNERCFLSSSGTSTT